jgi:D-serine deaminase-like pyridoxal phosphate-dependent protein
VTGRHVAGAGAGADAGATGAVADLELPVMLLHDDALDHNVRRMADWCRTAGVALAPHAKTHMSRELVRRQAAAGAWGFTAATTAQVRRLAGWGVGRVLHANVLVDRAAIAWVATHLLAAGSATEYLCYVDSDAGLDLLLAELAVHRPARPLPLLVELGFPGGRTGLRDDVAALALARRVAGAEHVRLAGVAAFEGLVPAGAAGSSPAGGDPAAPDGAVALLARVRGLLTALSHEGLVAGVPVVSAGGSSYPDLVVRELGPALWDFPVTTVLRSGCYVTHDHGVYRRTSPLGEERGDASLRPAFELRASVLSAPEDGRVVVGFGRREVPTDDRLPVVLGGVDPGLDVRGWAVTGVNDHHAFLAVPPGVRPAPGTVLRFGISHPCGAFDRWRHIPLVDGERVVGEITPRL